MSGSGSRSSGVLPDLLPQQLRGASHDRSASDEVNNLLMQASIYAPLLVRDHN